MNNKLRLAGYFRKALLPFTLTLLSALSFAAIMAVWSHFKAFLTEVAMSGQSERFYYVILYAGLFLLVIGVQNYVYLRVKNRLERRVLSLLYQDVFKAIFKKNIVTFREHNSGEYLSMMNHELPQIQKLYFEPLVVLIQQILMVIVASIALFLYDPRLLLLQLVLAIVPLVKAHFWGSHISKFYESSIRENANYFSRLKDYFAAQEYLGNSTAKKRILDQHKTHLNSNIAANVDYQKVIAKSDTLSFFLNSLNSLIFLVTAAYLVSQGEIVLATLIGAMQIANYVSQPLTIIGDLWTTLRSVKPTLHKVETLLQSDQATDDGLVKNEDILPICLQNYSVRVEEKVILNPTSLCIEAGKKYAIVGPSGSGKSTLMKSLMGFYNEDYSSGNILYGPCDRAQQHPECISNSISYIEQRVFLLEGSLWDNVTLYQDYTDAEVGKALKAVKSTRFLEKENAKSFHVAELGSNLSGGEIQKIAIARSLLEHKKIVLCDEITAGIDAASSQEILRILLDIPDLTVVFISHELNAGYLSAMDEIIFIDKGTVLEKGSLDTLIANKGAFYHYLNYHQAFVPDTQ